jgi:spore germination cell wall hydrolase CwlJ-like protein|tara:strand:- start:682 stop:1161 length:480 start_codon:yes stop_codon:yes gene_type:complete
MIKKTVIGICMLPVIFQAVLILNCATVLAHTHNNVKLTRETKVIAITILAEARGEGQGGMYAVAAVIAQRAFERGRTPTEICLKPYQFSCWNGKKLNSLEHLLKVPQAKYAIALAKNIKLLSRDFVGFANHYHNNKVSPKWAKGNKPVKVIGNHLFYKL